MAIIFPDGSGSRLPMATNQVKLATEHQDDLMFAMVFSRSNAGTFQTLRPSGRQEQPTGPKGFEGACVLAAFPNILEPR